MSWSRWNGPPSFNSFKRPRPSSTLRELISMRSYVSRTYKSKIETRRVACASRSSSAVQVSARGDGDNCVSGPKYYVHWKRRSIITAARDPRTQLRGVQSFRSMSPFVRNPWNRWYGENGDCIGVYIPLWGHAIRTTASLMPDFCKSFMTILRRLGIYGESLDPEIRIENGLDWFQSTGTF